MILEFLKKIKVLFALYLTVILVFIYLGYSFYQDSLTNEYSERSKELSSISKLKYTAIVNWYNERFADADFLFKNKPLQCLIDDYFHSGLLTDSLNIVSTLSTMYKNHDYTTMIVRNASGQVILNLNPDSHIVFFDDSLYSSIYKKQIVFSDIYLDSLQNTPSLDFYVPVLCDDNFTATIIMKIDLDKLLYPIISRWYSENSSGESLIVRAEKDSIISLSPLRLANNKIFVRRSKNKSKLPAAKAIGGSTDIIEGVDYRGVEVLADVRPIANLPWFLITKIDLDEVYAPVSQNTLNNILILGLITSLGGLLLLYYHNRVNYNNLKKVNETEQRLKDILDYSTNMFYSHTTEHSLTYISPQSFSIFGYKPEELRRKWTELSTDNPINLKGLELTNRAIESGKTQPPYKLELYKKNGDIVWVEVREAPVVKDGKTVAIVGALTDITSRKEAEEQLRILSKAIEQSPVSVIITDSEGKIQYVNQTFTNVTGYRLDEVYNFNPRILKSGKQSEKIYKELWETILKGKTWQGELQNKKKNGELFWESVIISSIINDKGEITNFIAVKEDISDTKLQFEILRENEEKFRLVFDNSNEALFLTIPDGSIEAANPAACRMFQYTEAELVSIGREGIIDASDPRFNHYLEERQRKGKTVGEVTFIRKNGEKFTGELSSSVFKDKDGKLKTSTIVRDITERKKIEKDLLHAKEKAEEASKIKSNFLATMSHELRTPLVGILGYAELLSKELENPEYAEMSETILQSGNRLLDTLNSILDLSRIEANKVEYTASAVNMIEVLNESVNLFKRVAANKNLTLDSYFPESSILIQSDKDLLLKIFNNLISNAIKYTREGGIDVKVLTKKVDSNTYVVIDVKDTGIGISPKYHEVVFEPFRQVSEGLSRVFEGTGLGLAVTKKLVEILNGKITFTSEPGKGSIFSVEFPVSKILTSHENSQISEKKSTNMSTPEELSSDISILIVEDDFSNAVMIRTYIEEFVTIDHVFTGLEAIEKCKGKKYDAILMDINLKGIDGVETFKQIRLLDDHYSKIPVIAITAYAMKGDKEKFLSAGFDYYIPKPFKQSQLLDVLLKFFGK